MKYRIYPKVASYFSQENAGFFKGGDSFWSTIWALRKEVIFKFIYLVGGAYFQSARNAINGNEIEDTA